MLPYIHMYVCMHYTHAVMEMMKRQQFDVKGYQKLTVTEKPIKMNTVKCNPTTGAPYPHPRVVILDIVVLCVSVY